MIAYKYLRVLLLCLFILVGLGLAQDSTSDNDEKRDANEALSNIVEATNLSAPSSPAFILLDVSPKNIPESGMNLEDLKLDLVIKDKQVVSNAAIEIQPFNTLIYRSDKDKVVGWLDKTLEADSQAIANSQPNGASASTRDTIQVDRKPKGYLFKKVVQSMKISLGTAEKDSTRGLAIGTRVNLLRSFDLIYDQAALNSIARDMANKINALGHEIRGLKNLLDKKNLGFAEKIARTEPRMIYLRDSLEILINDILAINRYGGKAVNESLTLDNINNSHLDSIRQFQKVLNGKIDKLRDYKERPYSLNEGEIKETNTLFESFAANEVKIELSKLENQKANLLEKYKNNRSKRLQTITDSLADAHWNAFTLDLAYGYMWSYDSPHVDSLKLKQEGFAYWFTSSFGPHKKVKANVMYKHSLMSGVKLDEYGVSVMIGNRKQSFFFEYLFSPAEEMKYHTFAYGGNIKMSKTIAVELGLRTQYEKGLTRLTDFIPAINFRWNGKSIPVLN